MGLRSWWALLAKTTVHVHDRYNPASGKCILINTLEQLREAAALFEQQESLAIDLEAVCSPGRHHGQFSLLQIALPSVRKGIVHGGGSGQHLPPKCLELQHTTDGIRKPLGPVLHSLIRVAGAEMTD